MTQRTRGFLGFAIALFAVSGVFLSSGFGGHIIHATLLFTSAGIALLVMMIDSSRGYAVRSVVGVVLFCALGFAIGWGPFQYVERARVPAAVVGGGTR